MTPAQLDHLRRIDAHLANLLATAEKRTPGEWEWTDANAVGEPQLTSEGGALVCTVHHECVKPVQELNACADFIAACAGNAEAGWRATRAAIEFLLLQDIITRPTQWTVLRKALDEAFASLQSSNPPNKIP